MAEAQYVGFLNLLKNKAETNYIGAVLVTDLFGVPIEFRCTHPVKPTEIQKQLYGSTLERHIGVELCGKPLLSSLQRSLNLVFVKTEFLLGVRDGTPSLVLFVRRTGEVLRVDPGEQGSLGEMTFDPKHGTFESVVVKVNTDFCSDLDAAKELIASLFQNVDPLEPFECIAKAVEALSKQDTRFQ